MCKPRSHQSRYCNIPMSQTSSTSERLHMCKEENRKTETQKNKIIDVEQVMRLSDCGALSTKQNPSPTLEFAKPNGNLTPASIVHEPALSRFCALLVTPELGPTGLYSARRLFPGKSQCRHDRHHSKLGLGSGPRNIGDRNRTSCPVRQRWCS